MTVCKLGRNKMKISLTDSEVRIFFGGYSKIDYSDPKTRMALSILLHEAIPDSSFAENSGRMMIEVKSIFEGGCEILLTKLSSGNNRRDKKICVLEFTDSENMILAVKKLYNIRKTRRISSSVYKMTDCYRIIISSNDIDKIIGQLSDYLFEYSDSVIEASYTDEYGKLLSDGNAVEELGRIFS